MIGGLVVVHILSGALGLLSGFLVLVMAKGSQRHKRVGKLFVYSMLILGLTGAIVGFARWIPLSALNGLLVCYFVLTAVLTIRGTAVSSRTREWLLAVSAALLAIAYVWFGIEARGLPDGKLGGFSSIAYFVFGTVTAFALAGDGHHLLVRARSGRGRIIRHLWRMFFPLFMATAAFFLGQAKLFPAAVQQSLLIFAPVVIVVGAMLFWSARVQLRGSSFGQ